MMGGISGLPAGNPAVIYGKPIGTTFITADKIAMLRMDNNYSVGR